MNTNLKISDRQWIFLLIPVGASAALCCLYYFFRHMCSNNESESFAKRPSGDNFVAEFDEKQADGKLKKVIWKDGRYTYEGQNLPPPNYEVATEQFKATCHYCDKSYHSEESLKMHLVSHRIELNQ